MINEGIFVPLDSEAMALVWNAVTRSGFPQTSEGLALWMRKQATATTPTVPSLIHAGRDYIQNNPQAVQSALQILGSVLRGKPKP